MKYLIITFFLLIFSIVVYGQTNSSENIVIDPISAVSTVLTETSDKTIYLSPNGSDVTGKGTQAQPYQTILKGLESLNDRIIESTITFSLDSGQYVWSQAVKDEYSRFEMFSSTIYFEGSKDTIISGISLSKNATYDYSYTGIKVGLTLTKDEYVGYYMSNATGTDLYPICYNNADTDTFQIDILHKGKASYDRVYNLESEILNTTSSASWLDFDYKISNQSSVAFKYIKLNSNGALTTIHRSNNYFDFDHTSVITAGLDIGDDQVSSYAIIDFFKSAIINSNHSTSTTLTIRRNNSFRANRLYINGSSASVQNRVVSFSYNNVYNIGNLYIYGRSAIPAFRFNGGNLFAFDIRMAVRDCDYLFDPLFVVEVKGEETSGATPTIELLNNTKHRHLITSFITRKKILI